MSTNARGRRRPARRTGSGARAGSGSGSGSSRPPRVPDGRATPRGEGEPAARVVPPGVRVVVGAALLEALVLGALAVWGVVQLVAGRQSSPGVVLFLVVFALVTAVALVFSARALWAGRRTGRAPVATWQLLQGAVALVVLQATAAPAAWVVLVVSAAVFLLLLTRPVVVHTVDR